MKRQNQIIVVCAAAVIVVGTGVLGLRKLNRPTPPEPQTSTPEEAVEYLGSEQFVKAAEDDKKEYVRQMQIRDSNTPVLSLLFNPTVTEEQRQKVLKNILPVMAPVIEQRLNDFQQLPPAQQVARLDAIIDQMQAFRKTHPETKPSAERLSMILQYVDPHTRAKLRKHMPALWERMKQRGIEPGPLM